jgi:hypothetical protein
MIRRCPKCNAPWPPEVDYCPRDGTRTIEASEAEDNSDWAEAHSTGDRGSDWVQQLSTGERDFDWSQKPVAKETVAFRDEPPVPVSTQTIRTT